MNYQKRALFQDVPNYTKLIIAFFVIGICFLFSIVLGIGIALPIFNIGIKELANIANLENVALLKYLQLVQSIGLFILPPFIIGYLFTRHSFSYLRLKISPKQKSVLAVILLMIFAIPAINLFAQINIKTLDYIFSPGNWMKEMEDMAMKTTEIFLNTNSVSGLFVNIFLIAIIPAIGEELIFRGVLQKIFLDLKQNLEMKCQELFWVHP